MISLSRPSPAGPRSRPWSPPAPGPGPGRGVSRAAQYSARSRRLIRSAAATTAGACSRPGERVSRSIGPGDRDRGDHPAARAAHRRRHRRHAGLALGRRSAPSRAGGRSASVAAVNSAPRSPRCMPVRLLPGAAAPARPIRRSSAARRRPARCRAARWPARRRRRRPARRRRGGTAGRSRRSVSRSQVSTGPARRPAAVLAAAAASSAEPGAEHEPALRSRASSRCASSATASRCAVGRGSPVASTSSASEAGPRSRAVEHERRLCRARRLR